MTRRLHAVKILIFILLNHFFSLLKGKRLNEIRVCSGAKIESKMQSLNKDLNLKKAIIEILFFFMLFLIIYNFSFLNFDFFQKTKGK